jgi:SAM-dependent methyltransferase
MTEPSWLEIFVSELAVATVARGYYRSYIDSLPLSGSERLLDFGSGGGFTARRLSRRLDRGGSVVCLDVSKRWISRARRRTRNQRNVRLVHGTIESADLTPESFDAVLAHFVIHDLPSRARSTAFVYFSVYLRKGGKLFVREPHDPSHGMSAAEIRRLAADSGFREAGIRQDKRATACVFVRV